MLFSGFCCQSILQSVLAGILFIFLWQSFESYNLEMHSKLISVDFEVFGRVQGVFFRKYTQQEACRLGLRGWCMNTHIETVKGVLEGNPSKIDQMKSWLQKTGSPASRIEKAVFSNEKDIEKHTFDAFKVKK